jgi:biopolymer transport protein ExbD
MSHALRSYASAVQAEINVTPLIDVMLALVMIMMITAPLALKRLPMPLGDGNNGPEPRTLALSIMSTGELHLQGVAVNRAELASLLAAEAAADQQPVLEIRSDADTPYEKVADTLVLAQNSGLAGIRVEGTRAN